MAIYRVKDGRAWGPYRQYGPGTTVELTEAEAAGFLDMLERVPDEVPSAPPDESEELAEMPVEPEPELIEVLEPEPVVKPERQRKRKVVNDVHD